MIVPAQRPALERVNSLIDELLTTTLLCRLCKHVEVETMAECPVCGAEVPLDAGTVRSELIECGDCGSELEVLSTDPMTLGEAPEVEEDWGE